jgi:hypothetical protein
MPVSRLVFPRALPCEQPLEAHLSGTIAHYGVECELMRLCVFRELHADPLQSPPTEPPARKHPPRRRGLFILPILCAQKAPYLAAMNP